ncbi:MAG: hypothetical protein PHW63_00455 [Alphaproteobacteria bacterium]|nr:hypothetical protein [Alphaproteobacteria bacterium]
MLGIAFLDFRPLSIPTIDWGKKVRSFLNVTESPRFTYVMSVITTEDDMREPTSLGMIYRDELLGKTYSADSLLFEKKGNTHKSLCSALEVERPEQLKAKMTRAAFKKAGLKPLGIDVENDFVSFLKETAEKAGIVFIDRRARTATNGMSPNGIPVCALV